MIDNSNMVSTKGYGKWRITTYRPEQLFGVYEGDLEISKDFHSIWKYDNEGKKIACIAVFPNPNVAAAESELHTEEM